MSEIKKNIWDVLQTPQLAGFATISDDGKPWVRYVFIVADGDFKIRFATFIKSRKVEQVKQNPEVHLTCGVNDPLEIKPYLQIQGRAKINNSHEIKQSFWNETLTQIFTGPDDPNYGIIEVDSYRIEYCTPGSLNPEVWVK